MPPHILFVLVDDMGWHFPGYHGNAEVRTPTIDALARGGVRLEGMYAYHMCSPSRSSLLTGRLPWRLAGSVCNLLPGTMPVGPATSYTFLPRHLATAGYFSAHFGKWHAGYHTPSHTPVGRGFDYSLAVLQGSSNHWTHAHPGWGIDCGAAGAPGKGNWDLWEADATSFPGRPVTELVGRQDDESVYSGLLFSQRAAQLVATHESGAPLFVLLALEEPHYPHDPPARLEALYSFADDDRGIKRRFHGLMSVVEEATATVTAAFTARGWWNNTLMVWMSDNGGTVKAGGSNHPLRGGKGSIWEGGVRVPGFVAGGAVPRAMRGAELHGLVSPPSKSHTSHSSDTPRRTTLPHHTRAAGAHR